jgi:FHS family Na+ dependent glucose MFS transporter 1
VNHSSAIRSRSPLALSAVYFATFVGLGMVAAVIGPSLPDLAKQTQVGLKQASLLFTAINLGYLAGALVSGRLFDRRPGHPVMAIALIVLVILVAVAPVTSQLTLLFLVIFVVGSAQGCLDVGGNTLIVWLHQEKVNPFMIALHLFWGVGTFLSPIFIAQAKLVTGSFTWGYWLIAILVIPVILLLTRTPSPVAPHKQPGASELPPANWVLVILFVLFYLAFVGAEGAYGGWIYSYAIATGISTEIVAAYLTSAYWGSLTLGRLVSIPLSLRFRSQTLLVADLAGCLVALVIAVLGGGSPPTIWLATIIMGASVATLFPVTLSFASEVITITGQFTGMVFVGASAGGMLIPWLIGQFFESAGPQSAMLIMLVDMVFAVGVFTLLYLKKRTA